MSSQRLEFDAPLDGQEGKAAKSVISCQVPSQTQKKSEDASAYAPPQRHRPETVPENLCSPGRVIHVRYQEVSSPQFCQVVGDHGCEQGCGGQGDGLHPAISREADAESQGCPGPPSGQDEVCRMAYRAADC